MNNTINNASVNDIGPGWLACPSCDHLYDLAALGDGQVASCHLCGHQLAACDSRGFSKVAAYAVAALIFLALGCSFPFMSFQEGGVESVMTLTQTVMELYTQGRPFLAFLVAGFIIIIPMSLMIIVLLLMMALARGWRKQWIVGAGHLVFNLQQWSMVEVFFIGVLVSLVKIMKMATVVIGGSFWAYAAFSICFILCLSNLDRWHSWRRIEALQE